jgi:hypothetical protein
MPGSGLTAPGPPNPPKLAIRLPLQLNLSHRHINTLVGCRHLPCYSSQSSTLILAKGTTMRTVLATGILLALVVSLPARAAVECGMAFDYTGPTHTPIWATGDGVAAYYFHSNSDVDTDGSGRSYHPDDIAGNKGLAQNTICNGVSRKSGGSPISCVGGGGACQKCLDLFRSVDKADMLTNFTDYFSSFAIATKGKAACVIPDGQDNAGFFVSTTSYFTQATDACDPAQYLDANVYPAIAVPTSLLNRGVKKGDLVVVRNRKNGRIGYGVVYDGSGNRIGESSVAMNRQILCQKNMSGCVAPPVPTSLKESYALVAEDVEFLIFKGTVGGWPTSPADVEARVKTRFADWGGVDRLDACDKTYAP